MKSVGILGTGKMGGAIAKGLSRVKGVKIFGYDVNSKSLLSLKESGCNIIPLSSPEELAERSEIIILAVKPGDVERALSNLPFRDTHTLISVAAGIRLQQIKSWAGLKEACRVMPNLAVETCDGVIGCFGDGKPLKVALKIFSRLGYAFSVNNEELLDTVTALAGSGPAFIAMAVEGLADGGVLLGLNREEALKVAIQVVAGTGRLLKEKKLHPAIFREMVTSPGGTTAEGLSVLEGYAFKKALIEAVRHATIRAKQLSGG